MKERGIIFNAEMVRAILDGRKTQTRRVMKVQPVLNGDRWEVYSTSVEKGNKSIPVTPWGSLENNCPYGKVGDHLWVRETYSLLGNEDACPIDWNDNIVNDKTEAARIYRASCAQKSGDYGLWSIPDEADWKPHTEEMKFEGSWTPSIHMPRWASRITLEITHVHVERLQSISKQDSISEGAPRGHHSIDVISKQFGFPDFSRSWFAQIWMDIYGEDNWAANPWVWVIEFKRV
ncbi:hypothetical protein U3C50_001637 [Providencia rettgeri]|nr:hypothetical protein [Providencia rettgeri]